MAYNLRFVAPIRRQRIVLYGTVKPMLVADVRFISLLVLDRLRLLGSDIE
jgi:hypothetical protein